MDWNNLHLHEEIKATQWRVLMQIVFERNTQLSFKKVYSCYKGPTPQTNVLFTGKIRQSCLFQFNKLNKLLMIKQIENVRGYTKCWKEFPATLMNGAAYWIFMNYEATWLVPLFHLKLILTGIWPTAVHTIESLTRVKANFSTSLKCSASHSARRQSQIIHQKKSKD